MTSTASNMDCVPYKYLGTVLGTYPKALLYSILETALVSRYYQSHVINEEIEVQNGERTSTR